MLAHRDRKRAAIAPLTKGKSWTDFCVQLTLGTYPGPVWNKEATQNGFGPCGESVSRKRGFVSPTTALMQHKSTAILQWEKQLHLVRRFGHFLMRLIRLCTHGEMMISTETDFWGDYVFVDSR